MLTHDRDYDNLEEEEDILEGAHKTSTADKTLFTLLKDLRKEISRKEICLLLSFSRILPGRYGHTVPISVDELLQITGVGTGKAQKYGEPFLELIAQYVEENDIIRLMIWL